jgi:hypothetical protein
MIERRRQAPAVAEAASALAVRDGEAIALEDTGALRRLVRAPNADAPGGDMPADLRARLAPLLPVAPTPDEPEWLRAEEMLEEAAACPGERLFAGTLAAGAQWWRAAEMREALRLLRQAIGSGDGWAGSADAGRVAQDCTALDAALARLDPGTWVQVREAADPAR